MRIPATVVLLITFAGCQVQKTSDVNKDKPNREKTTAEKAYDASDRARKKAEAIKAEQDKKNKEAASAGDQ